MSENSVLIINLKELHKINDAYSALNLTGVCVDYDDEIQMKFERRIIIGQILHKYPAYRDLKNGDNDCLVFEMKKAYPKKCFVEETKVFRFMILGSELVLKLLQVQINSFLAFMNFKMFRTFHSSEPSFSIGNCYGFVWIMPNLKHNPSKVTNCTKCIEKMSAKHTGNNEINVSGSRNSLRERRPDAQEMFAQGTCIDDCCTSTPVTKKKNKSSKLMEGFAKPKTTSAFFKESRETRREQKSKPAKIETAFRKGSVLVGKNNNTCLNTNLQNEMFSSSDHGYDQEFHRKHTYSCSQIAVSCRKRCNSVNCSSTNYITNTTVVCNSRSKALFDEQKLCSKHNICECNRRNGVPVFQVSEPCHSREHDKTSVRNCINVKYSSLVPVSDKNVEIRNCNCHEQKLESFINVPSIGTHERVQNWLNNVEDLPKCMSITYFNNNFDSQPPKTQKLKASNYLVSKSNNAVKRKTDSIENKFISVSNNRKKRKLFYVDPNVSDALIKVHAAKTKRIFSKEDCREFEDNRISPETDKGVSDTRNFSKISNEKEEKEKEIQDKPEECTSGEEIHSVCNLESHETDSESKLSVNDDSKTLDSNNISQNSVAEECISTENAELQINKSNENNQLDLCKKIDHNDNCDSCNLTLSTIPVTNGQLNINSQQTESKSSQPYYDAQENSQHKDSSVGTELRNIFKTLSEQSVTSLENLFSYEDKEAREGKYPKELATLAKLRKLNQKVEIKAVLVDILPELNHIHPLAIVRGVCRSGCKKYFFVEELPSYRDVILTKCQYCKQKFHRICPECTKDGDKFLCLLYSFSLHVLYGTNVIRIAVFGRSAVRFLGCPLETYLSWSSISSNIIAKFNKIRVSMPPEDWSGVTMLQLNLITIKHYDGTIVPKLVNTYFGDALYRKGLLFTNSPGNRKSVYVNKRSNDCAIL